MPGDREEQCLWFEPSRNSRLSGNAVKHFFVVEISALFSKQRSFSGYASNHRIAQSV
jgi:hypothetical protein